MKDAEFSPPDRDMIFSAVMEVMDSGKKDSEGNVTKIVKAIAASGSYWISFLNVIYSRLNNMKKLLKEKSYEQIEKEIDILTKAVSDIKKKI